MLHNHEFTFSQIQMYWWWVKYLGALSQRSSSIWLFQRQSPRLQQTYSLLRLANNTTPMTPSKEMSWQKFPTSHSLTAALLCSNFSIMLCYQFSQNVSDSFGGGLWERALVEGLSKRFRLFHFTRWWLRMPAHRWYISPMRRYQCAKRLYRKSIGSYRSRKSSICLLRNRQMYIFTQFYSQCLRGEFFCVCKIIVEQ